MRTKPDFDEIFAVMAAASVGDTAARVALPDDPQLEDLTTRFAIALNVVLDDLAQRSAEISISEARKTAILESALDAIVSMDHEGKIVEFNPAAEKMFGHARDDVIGKPMAEVIIPPSLRERHLRGLKHYLATGEGPVLGKRLELSGMRVDGSEFPLEVTIVRVNLAGQPPLFTGFLRDITRRKRNEEDLRRSLEALRKTDEERRTLLAHLVKAQEEERKRIASDVHDDSIQVMAAVGVRLGMLKGRLTDPDQLRWIEKLEHAVQLSIGRLRHLLFQLAPPALEKEGLGAALRAYLEEAFSEDSVTFHLESLIAAEPSREIRTLVYRIAQEALSNVRKHAQARQVGVRLEEVDGGLFVQIRDDGVGFSPSDVETPLPGHLGLVSMRERAEMLGGWFRIDSKPGAGSSVEYWVPVNGTEPDQSKP
jgi:PAS domain S-box-containing protein